MAKQSKATKAVIASLLATSAIVPAMAVSAADATTPAEGKTIEFKLEDSVGGILSNYIKSPGAFVELDGKQYIQVSLPDAVLALVKSVTVNGTSIIVEKDGKKIISVPVTADYAPVKIDLELSIGKATATVTPDKASIKGGEPTKPAEETKPAEKLFKQGKEYKSVADGTYDIKWDAYKGNVGNYTAITSQVSPDAKLVVKDGKYFVEIATLAKSNHIITKVTVEGKEAKVISGTDKEGDVRTFSFEIDAIGDLHAAKIDLNVGGGQMMSHEFGFAIETADLKLPEAGVKEEVKPEPTSETMPVYVYKDGTSELSIMQGKYLADKVTVTTTEGGFDVDVTFPEGQHLNDFKVEGATVALKSEEVVGANTVKIYTVSVDDLSKLYTATADLTVKVKDEILYEEIHKVQLQFGEKAVEETVETTVPFTDIEGNAQYNDIVALYNLGVFKAADKFNPNSNLKRAHFALMLSRALTLDVPATTEFKDITNFDTETQDAIKVLKGIGVINGTSATTFGPSDDITRKQAALMIYRLLEKQGYEATGATANFSDLPKEEEAAKAIAELSNLGIISGNGDKFAPEDKLTRAHMAKIINNTLTALASLK